MRVSAKLAATSGSGLAAAALWWRTHPSACPYGQRFWVQAPHPFITRDCLRESLAPLSGERILEVGPGTGYYTLTIAEWVGPSGQLDIFDVQQEMLDYTLRLAGERGLANVQGTRGDARELPYANATFDGAVLTAVLGEIPDQIKALAELRRVLKPAGRLIVGELLGDPHFVSPRALRRRAEPAGLFLERREGPPFGYFARLVPAGIAPAAA